MFQITLILKNQSTCKIINLYLGENYSWHKINYMRKLSNSQKSPFNQGLFKNCSYVFLNKKYYRGQEEAFKKYIEWNKILENKN